MLPVVLFFCIAIVVISIYLLYTGTKDVNRDVHGIDHFLDLSSQKSQDTSHQVANMRKKANANRIHFRLYGNGSIKVLLVIGLGTNHQYWHPQIEYIQTNEEANRKFQICVMDNLGSGLSSTPMGFAINLKKMGKHVLKLVRHLGWKSFHLCGQSMGGLICQSAAIQLFELKKSAQMIENKQQLSNNSLNDIEMISLTLLNTFPHVWNWDIFLMSSLSFFLKIPFCLSMERFANVVIDQMFSKKWLDSSPARCSSIEESAKIKSNRQWLTEMYLSRMYTKDQMCSFGGVKQVLGILSHYYKEEQISSIPNLCPVLLIGSKRDRMVHSKCTERLHKMMTHQKKKDDSTHVVRLEWFEDAGHIVNVECDKEFNKLVFEDWILSNHK